MKLKTSRLVLTLFVIVGLTHTALPQTTTDRPRRAISTGYLNAGNKVVGPAYSPASSSLGNGALNDAQGSTIETVVPREGLQLYLEIRKGGLTQLAQSSSLLAPLTKLYSASDSQKVMPDLSGFMMKNIGALSSARLAVISYGARGAAVLIEASSQADANNLSADLQRLFGVETGGPAGWQVSARDRIVMTGARAVVASASEVAGAATLAGDQQFVKAQERFSTEPFFAYLDLGSSVLPWPGNGPMPQGSPYTAGMLSALSGMPGVIAIGGTLQPDSTLLRALLVYNQNSPGGLLSSIISSSHAGQPLAARFAAADADLFVTVLLDWNKLYEAIESLFGMFAGTMAGSGAQLNGNSPSNGPPPTDMFALIESSLGFSIKNDLIPTLGNEVAFTVAGFEGMFRHPADQARTASAGHMAKRASNPLSPRFMLLLAVREPVKFEKLLARILRQIGGKTAQPFARTFYRGATISHRKGLAYTISDGFLIVGGGADEIHRALDAHAQGTSLASTMEFRAAVGDPRPTMFQLYLSGSVSGILADLISTEAKTVKAAATETRTPLGLVMSPDSEGMMLEMRVPTNLALKGLASMIMSSPAGYPASSSRRPGGRKTPTLTEDDVRGRRP